MSCLVCMRSLESGDYHARCAQELFGTKRIPEIDADRARLQTFALAMVGRTTLSGAQEKLSLGYVADRSRLIVASGHVQFILKPQQGRFAEIPENEHVTMWMARELGIDVPPFGLVRLRDGSTAYLVRRFDRTRGKKLQMEDFCQLAEKHPAEKYDGSGELCVRLLRKFGSEPLVDIRDLFQRVVFSWWTGNGDMHLKNFALLTSDRVHRLSPAYDLLCTQLVIPDDQLALPIGGKRDRLRRSDFEAFARYGRIPQRAAKRVLDRVLRFHDRALELLAACFLSSAAKAQYAELIHERTELLAEDH